MAVLNVTPDSFSDGGRWFDTTSAIERGIQLLADGADLVDVGGESTRPGAQPVQPQEEARRVLPVIAALVERGVPVSIDTMHAAVARAAVGAGAVLVNDVTGGLGDPAMLSTVAALDCSYAIGHWQMSAASPPTTGVVGSPLGTVGRHVVHDVVEDLRVRISAAAAAGVDPARTVVDPGIGFDKDADQNWAVLAGIAAISALGRPVLVGVSRKRFVGSLLADPDGQPRPVSQRDVGSAALAALLSVAGVWAVRAHDAAMTRDAVTVGCAWRRAVVA